VVIPRRLIDRYDGQRGSGHRRSDRGDHVGEDDSAARVDRAVEQHLATRGDEKLSTTQVGDRIAASL
jgi:hypothetical protein